MFTNKVQILPNEMQEFAKLTYLTHRHKHILAQRKKYKVVSLKDVAEYLNVATKFEIYKMELIKKYPVLNVAEFFKLDYQDNYIYF